MTLQTSSVLKPAGPYCHGFSFPMGFYNGVLQLCQTDVTSFQSKSVQKEAHLVIDSYLGMGTETRYLIGLGAKL